MVRHVLLSTSEAGATGGQNNSGNNNMFEA
jgi:hypothetical protein